MTAVVIDVIIPTVTGREKSLKRCIQSYVQNSEYAVRLHVEHGHRTCGLAWNAGVAKALMCDLATQSDFIHLTADDLEALPGWDVAAVRAASSGLQPAPKLLNADDSIAYYGLQAKEPREGTVVEFSTVPFLPTAKWSEIGPSLEGHYYTDNWLSWRAHRIGVASAYYPGYAFRHHHEMAERGAGMTESQRMQHDHIAYQQAKRAAR